MSDPAQAIATPIIAKFETFVSRPYYDSGNVPTYGFGFTYLEDGSPVTMHTPPISYADAYARLSRLVAKTLYEVREMIIVPISNNAAAACCSFAYNEGLGRFHASSILRHINANDMSAAAGCFSEYNLCRGRVLSDLVERRRLEAELFVHPDGATPQRPTTPPPPVTTYVDATGDADNSADALNAQQLADISPPIV